MLIILLIIAAAVSVGLWLYDRGSALPYEAMAIFAIVLLNAIMGHVQQARAEQLVAGLHQMSAAHANVLCDGARQSIVSTELVPGDIILVEEGDAIPADARLIQSTALQVAESALTGESLPVSKDTAAIVDEAGLGDGHNMIFSGTAATYGHGRAVVTATGMRTEMGRIAGVLKGAANVTTPLQKELDWVGKGLAVVVVVIAVVMIATILPVEGVRGFSALLTCSSLASRLRWRPFRKACRQSGKGGSFAGRAAHGATECHHPPSRGGRDARLGKYHRLRQDRHADQEGDDGARRRHSEWPRDLYRYRLCARRRHEPGRRQAARRRAAVRAGPRTHRRRPCQQRGAARA
jgi:hypothetical protein